MPDYFVKDGELFSKLGIAFREGVRCPHGVVDGDKPIAVEGPRCLTCRSAWYPVRHVVGDNGSQTAYCAWGCKLHQVYLSQGTGIARPFFWAHDAPQHFGEHTGDEFDWRNEFPIAGLESRFGFNGWGRWEAYTEQILEQYKKDEANKARNAK